MMISKQEVLKIVAEKHSLILGDDDPILSVLAVSDAIYDIYTTRLSEQMEIILMKNTKFFTQRSASLQAATAVVAKQITDESRRGLTQVLETSRSDWQSTFAHSHDMNQSVISELKKIRTQILVGLAAVTCTLALFSLVIWTRGV